MQVEQHPGSLPQQHSFLRISPETVALTAMKKAEDSNALILRFYDWAGKSSAVTIDVPPGAASATETNLMEKPEGAALSVSAGHQITSTVHPYEIQTIEVNYPSNAGLQP